LGSCNYDETKAKSSAIFELCKDESAVFEKLALRLSQQLKAYPDELLGVACPKNDDVTKVRAALEAVPQLSSHLLDDGDVFDVFDLDKRICICSMHDAKGLEFRAMHLPFAEHLTKMGDTQKRLAFTSVTRAKTSLTIYHVQSLPGYLEQARDKNAPAKAPPDVRALFPAGRKK